MTRDDFLAMIGRGPRRQQPPAPGPYLSHPNPWAEEVNRTRPTGAAERLVEVERERILAERAELARKGWKV